MKGTLKAAPLARAARTLAQPARGESTWPAPRPAPPVARIGCCAPTRPCVGTAALTVQGSERCIRGPLATRRRCAIAHQLANRGRTAGTRASCSHVSSVLSVPRVALYATVALGQIANSPEVFIGQQNGCALMLLLLCHRKL